jgi:glycopeptide antibiotics resistance protein
MNSSLKKVWRVIVTLFLGVLLWSFFCRVAQVTLHLSSDTIAPIWVCGIGIFVLVLIVQIARGKFKYNA